MSKTRQSFKELQELVAVKHVELEARLGMVKGVDPEAVGSSPSVKELASLHKLERTLDRRRDFELLQKMTSAPKKATR